MANTDKQNFRCDTMTRWRPAMEKIADMREAGYDVSMTRVLCAVVDLIRDSDAADILMLCERINADVPYKGIS